MRYNYLGDVLDANVPEFIDESNGYYDELGNPVPYWLPESEYVDSDGFDKLYEGTEGYWDEIILPVGTMLSRYGNVRGRLTTDVNTEYDRLGLPYKPETMEYHEYIVVDSTLKVKCMVKKGKVYPMFQSKGGAIQYKHFQSIDKEIRDGKLKEEYGWMSKKK